MRDIVITLAILALIPLILRKARIGTYAWAWVSLMVPHRLGYGFSLSIPFAQIIAIATLIGFLFSKERHPFPWTPVTTVYVLFVAWMSFTTIFALNPHGEAFTQWTVILKIHLMMFVTLMLLRGRAQIEILVAVVAISVGFYGVKGGLWTILTGGGSRVWGPPGGIIQGNNELGLSLVMLVPFFYYFFSLATKRWHKVALALATALLFFGILGTQSRGALLAVLSMSIFLGLKSNRKAASIAGIGTVLVLAIIFMPDSWVARMQTIGTYDQDTSAMSRIYTWTTLWNLAVDRPFLGGGFRADNLVVFDRYAPPGGMGVYLGGNIYVAHSIYFQALGEHGFPGLTLFIGLGLVTWLRASAVAKAARDLPEYRDWLPLLMRMVQVSLVGFAVGGAFLSLVHFDLPYYIVGVVILADATLREHKRRSEKGATHGQGAQASAQEPR